MIIKVSKANEGLYSRQNGYAYTMSSSPVSIRPTTTTAPVRRRRAYPFRSGCDIFNMSSSMRIEEISTGESIR